MTTAVSVPANLLLMGEYAVLEEGGLGLALAPAIRVAGEASLEVTGTITGTMPGRTVRWPGDAGLLGLAASRLEEILGPLKAHISLDSRRLFTPDGQKRGLGSSAATIVALTALWTRGLRDLDSIFRTALDAHRVAQGGAGSGYDVACSTFGGVTLFTGGAAPTAERVDLPWLPGIRLFSGAAPVRTTSAVKLYATWKNDCPAEARTFFERSNELVSAFLSAANWPQAAEVLVEYRDLAVGLGDRIGVSARIAPGDDAAVVTKAIGAGNELGVSLGDINGELISISREGVMWQ